IDSALSLVAHGWAVRGTISERFSAARRRLREEKPAMAGLRPDVLLRDALQRGERRRIQDHVLRRLQIRASLEISNQARKTRQVGRPIGRASRADSARDPS